MKKLEKMQCLDCSNERNIKEVLKLKEGGMLKCMF